MVDTHTRFKRNIFVSPALVSLTYDIMNDLMTNTYELNDDFRNESDLASLMLALLFAKDDRSDDNGFGGLRDRIPPRNTHTYTVDST
jgi:hypothetical protein